MKSNLISAWDRVTTVSYTHLPEVDLFIKIDEYNQLWNKIEDLIKRDIVEKSKVKTSTKISEIKPLPMPTYNEFMERVVTTGKNYAYLKIGEGLSLIHILLI